jgi:flagellar export protein FliJ
MKKFKFTLQTVHKVRELREDREKLVLGELQAEVNKAAAHHEIIQGSRAAAMDDYARRLRSGEQFDPLEMQLHSNHFESLNRMRQEAEKELEDRRQAYLRQGENVAVAMRETKVTNQLREAQLARHELEYARREQNDIDELISASFAREILK